MCFYSVFNAFVLFQAFIKFLCFIFLVFNNFNNSFIVILSYIFYFVAYRDKICMTSLWFNFAEVFFFFLIKWLNFWKINCWLMRKKFRVDWIHFIGFEKIVCLKIIYLLFMLPKSFNFPNFFFFLNFQNISRILRK